MSLTAKKWLMLISALAFNIAGYLGINRLSSSRGLGYSVAIPLDFQIPYIKYFSPFYSIVYLVPVVTFFIIWRNYELVRGAYRAFLGAAALCFVIYWWFPVEFTDRYLLSPPYDFFENVVHFIYWIDRPFNCFPSLHVALVFISVQAIERFNARLVPWFFALATIITLSTLFIRQHYILDLVSGIALAYAMGWIFLPKKSESDVAAVPAKQTAGEREPPPITDLVP